MAFSMEKMNRYKGVLRKDRSPSNIDSSEDYPFDLYQKVGIASRSRRIVGFRGLTDRLAFKSARHRTFEARHMIGLDSILAIVWQS
jgi:hypothetical protein